MLVAPILSAFYPLIYNYSIKLFLDIMVKTQHITWMDVIYPLTLFLSTHVVVDVTWHVSNYAEWHAEPFVRQRILETTYAYVQSNPYTFFLKNKVGTITTRIKGVLDGYDDFWEAMHHGLFQEILSIIITMSFLFLVSTMLGLFIFAWGILFFTSVGLLSRKLTRLSFNQTEARHHLLGGITDRLINLMTIFSFAAERKEKERLHQEIREDFIPAQLRLYRYNFWLKIFMGIFYLVLFGSVTAMMIHARQKNLLGIGDFVFVFGLMYHIADHMWSITTKVQDFAQEMGNLKSAFSVIRYSEPQKDLPTPLKVTKGAISFENVSFDYDENEEDGGFLRNFNLHIEGGEKIGIVGYSGSGKTTLTYLLLQLFPLKRGRILIDGQDIAHVNCQSLRQNIAFIPQEPSLFNRSLEENITYGQENVPPEKVQEVAQKAQAHRFISRMLQGYRSPAGEHGNKLSGGQKQRIAIARAFLKDAPIVILDEATAALDSTTEKEIQKSLDRMIHNNDTTMLVIAHRLSTIRYMDRIVVLDKGQIVEIGTHKELSEKGGLYAELWEAQTQ
jgi:ATP-binding cassette subfamily B protein